MDAEPNLNKIDILKFALKSFYYKYKYVLVIILVSFAFSFLIRSSNLIHFIIGLCFFLIFNISLPIYVINFSNWYSLFDSAFISANRILNNIDKRIKDFDNINNKNTDEVIKKILQDIVNAKISNLNDNWRLVPFYSTLSGVILSWICLHIISGDALVEAIKWIADILKIENYKIIKDISVENILSYLITGFTFLSAFAILYSSKQIKEKLIDSLNEIENRSLI
ncbi:MAG: hypothetical protein AAF383_26025 [Cyanobacteria bacterium P01_A01_bin.83]